MKKKKIREKGANSHYGHHTRDMVQKVYQIKNPWNRRSHQELACPPFSPSS